MGNILAHFFSISISLALLAGMSVQNNEVSSSPDISDFSTDTIETQNTFALDMSLRPAPTLAYIPLGVTIENGEAIFDAIEQETISEEALEEETLFDELDTDEDAIAESETASDSSEGEKVIEADPFQTIAVTWPVDVENPEPMQIRVRDTENTEWSDWIILEANLTGPEESILDPNIIPRIGSESVYIGEADAIEVAPILVSTEEPEAVAEALSDIEVVLISSDIFDPIPTVVVENANWVYSQATELQNQQLNLTAATTIISANSAPNVVSRAQWGAQASRCDLGTAPSLKAAIIHHTAGNNSYSTQAAAMQQIRGDQAYHISLGWCDLGYNFVVDKWGNVYEGREGSLNAPKVGAHAAGFNTGTVGVSMLGNYDTTNPPEVMLDAAGRIAGWQLRKFGGPHPQSNVQFYTSTGSTKWAKGSTPTIPAIAEHRNVGNTACPGSNVYGQMNRIRAAAALGYSRDNQLPLGSLDSVVVESASSVKVSGWAFDPDQDPLKPSTVHVYVNGVGKMALDGKNVRSDVNALYSRPTGSQSGFSGTISGLASGTSTVCIYVINYPEGVNPKIGCKTVEVTNQIPKGALEVVEPSLSSVTIRGWAFDPDMDPANPASVHIYVNGSLKANWLANTVRSDINKAYGRPSLGLGGFSGKIDGLVSDQNTVCAYAINHPKGGNPQIGCKTVSIGNQLPKGILENVQVTSPTSITVKGWAFDPDQEPNQPIAIHVYVNNNLRANWNTSESRSEVNTANSRPSGSLSGFSGEISGLTPGKNTICAYAINYPSGGNPQLGCKTIETNRLPLGYVDAITALSDNSLQVRGWTFDPDQDSDKPISVHIYVNGLLKANWAANSVRSDVNSKFGRPASGVSGYNGTISGLSKGKNQVCVYAINQPSGGNPQLGCETVNLGVAILSDAAATDPIMGISQLGASAMASYLQKHNPSPNINVSAQQLAQLYLDEGARIGVRGDIAFAQAIHETGWFRFGGLVQSNQNNFAGIGATGTGVSSSICSSTTPIPANCGESFASAALGVRAHLQHLFAYATASPFIDPIVANRTKSLVTRPRATTWVGLNGTWAVPGTTYGQSIISRYNEMVTFAKTL
jgi:hypothetical protein